MSNIILQHWRHNENVLVDDKLKRSVPSPQFKVPQTYAAGLWLQILNPQPLIPQSPEGGEKHRSADFQRLPFRHGCISADEVKSDGNAVGRWGVKSVRVDGGLCKDLGRRNEENVVDVICTLPLSRRDAPSNPQLGFAGAGCLWQGAGQFHGALGTWNVLTRWNGKQRGEGRRVSLSICGCGT